MRFSHKILFLSAILVLCCGIYFVIHYAHVSDSSRQAKSETQLFLKDGRKDFSHENETIALSPTVEVDSETIEDCPLEGSARGSDLQQLNRLKNRLTYLQEDEIDTMVTLVEKLTVSGMVFTQLSLLRL